ncbi:MAG: aldo/keto reductase [Deltaproteobacteria bacterium]|nr:aldo/keto reductase [Deltaproteobacteria bacterium]
MNILNNTLSRLVLGTAQLGMDYGVANLTGKPNIVETENIVKIAWMNGIHEFDTAQGYGDGEEILGNIIEKLGINTEVKIISKINTTINHLDKDVLHNSIIYSIDKLKCTSLYGLMLHRESLLEDWDEGLGQFLDEFVNKGIVKYIGVSAYSTDKAIQALKTEGISIVQIPTNIIDHRFKDAGVFELADKLGKIIYIRSIYLQGLLLMDSYNLPENMKFAKPVLKDLCKLSREVNIERNEMAMGYVKSVYPNAKVLFGAETVEQVKNNIEVWEKKFSDMVVNLINDKFKHVDEKILNPSLW